LKRSTTLRVRVAAVLAVLATTSSPAAPALADGAATAAWHSYVLGPSSSQVPPVKVDSRGTVSHADALVGAQGGRRP
jgi:hypothetical protein